MEHKKEELKSFQSQSVPLVFKKADEYTGEAILNRWAEQRDAWLGQKVKGPDVHDPSIPRKKIPEDRDDLERKKVKKIMKAQAPPYNRFPAYYPLEDTIDLYM